jgi:ferritin-like metal-binding protein YciE
MKWPATELSGRGRLNSVLRQSAKLLDATLREENKTDETLTQLAESAVNQHAQAA